jgi:hypothetical protein
MEQDVIHRLAPAPRAFGEDPQVGARLLLADEIVERLRPQRAVGILGQALGAQGGIGIGHRHPLWPRHGTRPEGAALSFLRRQEAQRGADHLGRLRLRRGAATSATARAASAGA